MSPKVSWFQDQDVLNNWGHCAILSTFFSLKIWSPYWKKNGAKYYFIIKPSDTLFARMTKGVKFKQAHYRQIKNLLPATREKGSDLPEGSMGVGCDHKAFYAIFYTIGINDKQNICSPSLSNYTYFNAYSLKLRILLCFHLYYSACFFSRLSLTIPTLIFFN